VVYNIHFTFGKVHKKFTVFHKRNITSSQVHKFTSHTPEELSGWAE